ncbi:MAG: EAL domain-containing protein [Thermovenabulum sp.]|uniref:EAL domain-containing protein n=1 Tax=Thermovenabulum sp. TaxID=3100335 RepID=UPI003C7A2942
MDNINANKKDIAKIPFKNNGKENINIYDIVNRGELYFLYQPIISLNKGQFYGSEALTRVKGYNTEHIEEIFIDAERYNLLEILERNIFKGIIEEYLLNQLHNCNIFINVTPKSLHNISELIKNETKKYNTKYKQSYLKKVVFEVTEFVGGNIEKVDRNIIEEIRSIGIKIAVDDVFSGYSRLAYIGEIKPDYIKIDKGYITKAANEEYWYKLLKRVIMLSHSLRAKTVIEGIETEKELITAKELKADYGQGFYISYPVPLMNIKRKIRGNNYDNC